MFHKKYEMFMAVFCTNLFFHDEMTTPKKTPILFSSCQELVRYKRNHIRGTTQHATQVGICVYFHTSMMTKLT